MDDVALGVERPKLIGEIVFEKMRDAIIDKRLPPGSRLGEVELAKLLGVSKTPVREALLRLRAVGLVTTDDGTLRVVQPSRSLIRYAYETRAGLEALTAELACSRASDTELAHIVTVARRSNARADAGDIPGFRYDDQEFHMLVSYASRNTIAAGQVMNIRDLCQTLRQRDVMTDQVSRTCGTAHLAIAANLAARECEAARRTMFDHITYVMTKVLDAMNKSA